MTLLTPQSNCENAPQGAPRIALLTGGPDRRFVARLLAKAPGGARQNRKSEPFGRVAGKQTHDANGALGLLQVPDPVRGNTFRKASRSCPP